MSIITADDELLKLIEAYSSSTSCSCSFCKPTGEGHTREGRDDVAVYRHRNTQDAVKTAVVKQIKGQGHNNPDFRVMEVQKKDINGDDTFWIHTNFCVGWLLDFLQPLTAPQQQQKHDCDLKMSGTSIIMNQDKECKSRQVPSIIICKENFDLNSSGERSSSIRTGNMRLRILQKADDLKTMLEKDLKNRTATETMSEYSSCLNKSTCSGSMSDDSSLDIAMIENSQEYLIFNSVSSISCPSFSDAATRCSKDNVYTLDDLDPLKVLNLEEDDHSERREEHIVGYMNNSNVESLISVDQFQECEDGRDDLDNLSVSRSRLYSQDCTKYSSDQRVLKEFEGSFLSYEDIIPKTLTLDIADGISYDEDGTDESNLLSMPLNTIESSIDDRADLDNLCQESIQSAKSLKSFHTAEIDYTFQV
mmetsp:Transcript_4767/g.7013  ORF Transcript_4767/g.7013 Transcript_4767/m.7013 type:complete len:419 (+) Transcript_4767:61-1317(+)